MNQLNAISSTEEDVKVSTYLSTVVIRARGIRFECHIKDDNFVVDLMSELTKQVILENEGSSPAINSTEGTK